MRICVTGGMGYIGSELSLALHKAGHEVIVYDWKLKQPHHDLFHCNDFDFDVVFHLAALAGNVICDQYPEHIVRGINVASCTHIVNKCHDDTLIVFASSSAVYGKPRGLYAESKLAGEHQILKHKKAVCLRLATIYGVSHSMRKNILVNDLVKSAVLKKRIDIWNYNDTRPYIHIEDCIKAFMLFATYDTKAVHGQILDAYSAKHFSTKEKIAFLVRSIRDCKIVFSGEKDKYPQDFYPSLGDYDGWFEPAKAIGKDTLYPLIEYYDR